MRLIAAVLLLALPLLSQAYVVSGGQILDEDGKTIQLRGVNWFGFETESRAPQGLWKRNWKDTLDQMQALGFNALRVPLCPDTIHGSPTKTIDFTLNPDLKDLDSAQVLDKFVREVDRRGMYVLLDHHRPNCEKQSELWYSRDYSEKDWLNDLTTLAKRFRDVPHVIGVDLMNEPHGAATWGTGKVETDWNLAAERASKAVLGVAPQWLMFVGGVGSGGKCAGADPAFWGENLAPLACRPLDVPSDRLVLAPHTYGPDVYKQPYFDDAQFPANMPVIWDRNFGQFVGQGYAVILGEFGGRYGDGDPRDRVWQDMLVDYLRKHGLTSAFYWAWNPNSGDTGGLVLDDWKTVREDKMALLRRLWKGAPAATARPQRAPVRRTTLPVTIRTLSDWSAGYCVDVQVRNEGTAAAEWRADVPVEGATTQIWNAVQDGGGFVGVDWNHTLAAGKSASFGFCALRASKAAPPPAAKASDVHANNGFEVKTAVDSDWKAGYCLRVFVRNRSNAAATWEVRLPMPDRLRETWKARVRLVDGELIAGGEDYNAKLASGEATDFGFCALR